MPPLMSNHGCYIGSLGALTRWLAEQAEALGVEIYPGFSVVDVIFGANGEIEGVITGDMGVARDGSHKDNYTPGIAIVGKYTLFAEGARGSLSKMLIRKLGLDAESGPQKFGIGLKELWEVPAEKHKPGLVQHTMGWPLDDKTGGGSFLYHFGERLVSVGFVVHLDYANPYLNPFKEFQRAKTHPLDRRASRRRQAHRLWRARVDRRRLPGDPAACLSRRRADRLRGGLHERAAHQGQSQRDAVGDDGGGGGVRGDRAGRVRATCSKPIRKACRRARWRKS